MRLLSRAVCAVALALMLLPLHALLAHAEDWVVTKATGQVWHATSNAQPVSLGAETRLAAGDLVQTGPSGRILLTRGNERILVAPNSIVSLPKTETKPGITTILQQAGSILVEAEKKDHKHFEVVTPYLAAVVKGTQFTVSVSAAAADVNVQSGKVEVADVKSGKTALVLPGQFAHVGKGLGLTLGGKGAFEPVIQGPARSNALSPVAVPKQGFQSPPKVDKGLRVDNVKGTAVAGANVVRLGKALGPLSLDAGAATAGLIRSEGSINRSPSIWKAAADPSASSTSNTNASSTSSGTGTSATPGVLAISTPGASGVSASVASPGASNSGNGVGNAFGLTGGNGVGNAFGLNGGNGVGKALGLGKKSK